MRFADRIQRKHLIVGGALAVIVCAAFAQVRTVVPLIVFGVLISLAGQTISVAYHAYQCELFPTEVRSRASGIAYSASRAGAIMSGFIIAALLKDFGVPGVFTGITVFMLVVVVVIGAFGPRTNGVRLEEPIADAWRPPGYAGRRQAKRPFYRMHAAASFPTVITACSISGDHGLL